MKLSAGFAVVIMVLTCFSTFAEEKKSPAVMTMDSISSLMGEVKTAEKRLETVQKDTKGFKSDADFKAKSQEQANRDKMLDRLQRERGYKRDPRSPYEYMRRLVNDKKELAKMSAELSGISEKMRLEAESGKSSKKTVKMAKKSMKQASAFLDSLNDRLSTIEGRMPAKKKPKVVK